MVAGDPSVGTARKGVLRPGYSDSAEIGAGAAAIMSAVSVAIQGL